MVGYKTFGTNEEMFEIFANLHPIEMYDHDSKRFCEYFRKKTGKQLTDEEIKEFVNNNRDWIFKQCSGFPLYLFGGVALREGKKSVNPA